MIESFIILSIHFREFYKRVNTRQQHEHTEKGFQIELLLENFGYHATVEAEYKNGDKLTLDGESHTAEDLLKLLMYKRLDLEEQFDWTESHTMLTLEEEALLFSTKEKKKKSKLSKKGGAKTSGAGGAIKGGGKSKK